MSGFNHDFGMRENGKTHTESLSIFFPCYNDLGSIGSLVERVDAIAQNLVAKYEVIVVDDGSSDGSREYLQELANRLPRLRLVFHEANRGYGGALRSGFAAAANDWVFYTDGDGQYDVDELKTLWERRRDEIDVVNGYKSSRKDAWYRRLIGRVYQMAMRWVFSLPIRDVDCDFRLVRRCLLEKITLTNNSGAITVELVKKLQLAGARFVELPVAHLPRLHGSSQFFKFTRVVRTLLDVGTLWRST